MAKRKGRPPKIDESGREILREIVTAQPYATLDEVTAEFTRRTELTVNAATVRKALRQAGLRQERGAVVVKRRSQEDEAAKQRYGYTDEHRRQEPDQRYPSCLTQTEWELVADLFEQSGKRGRPPQYSRWDLVNACCYVVRNGCSWRMLPREFPPWENVYRTFRRWAAADKFEQMHDRLRELWRSREEREPEPTAAVLDAQSTRSSPQGGPSGYDAGKKVKGRKRTLVVDTLGLLLMVSVVPANIQDRDGADQVVRGAIDKYPSLEKLYVDGGYSGTCAVHLKQEHQIDVEVVRHPANRNVGRWVNPDQGELFPVLADSKGFVVLPKRWVVERTHAWYERCRRLIMHHDRLLSVSEAWVWLTGARMLARRLTAAP